MANYVKIKKGLNIPLAGKASDELSIADNVTLYAISPLDYPGINWKANVKEGDAVEIGSALLYDKAAPSMKLTSPVSGTVKEVRRGERRRILYVTVEKQNEQQESGFSKRIADVSTALSEAGDETSRIRILMQMSGFWAFMRQRPFDIVPAAGSEPRDIFVTAFDSAPLAKPMLTENLTPFLDKGLEALGKLTKGKVYLGVNPEQKLDTPHAIQYVFDGPHPAGNVGPQIAAIKPVNKSETVWTLDAETVCRIGRLIADDTLDTTTIVALTGEMVEQPSLLQTRFGASLSQLLQGHLKTGVETTRIISGNVLTGTKCDVKEDFLRYPYRQITAIPEGDKANEFMGWASLNPDKYSVKRSFPSFLAKASKPFRFDARIKGGHRAPILSGEFDKVFPFDIYPEYLLRAIENGDIDKMENLGIYEVAPEDFALAEFVDSSKNPLQQIVRVGLDNLRKELE